MCQDITRDIVSLVIYNLRTTRFFVKKTIELKK